MNPIILALDTSTDACSVALSAAAQIYTEFALEPQAHSKLLLDMVNKVCLQAGINLLDVEAFAFGSGPGSFTGVRIAASVIQGLAFGTQKPVIAVSSLRTLAQQAALKYPMDMLLAILDARQHEVYCAEYRANADGIVQAVAVDALYKPDQLGIDPKSNYLAFGTGANVYRELLQRYYPNLRYDVDIIYPRASELLQIACYEYKAGSALTPSAALPTYIRNDVAKKSKKNPDLGSRD